MSRTCVLPWQAISAVAHPIPRSSKPFWQRPQRREGENMAKAYKVVGKKVERVDALERLSGEATYASDIFLPGTLYAKFLRSPLPHAKVVRIDTSKAQALPGVKMILTASD